MTAPRVAAPSERWLSENYAARAWQAIGLLGLAFFAVGMVDVLLAWLPPHFGNPEWEFGTITATLNNLPVPTIGLGLLAAYALTSERTALVMTVCVWSALMAIFLVVDAVFYALDVPLALRAVTNPVAYQGLRTAITKGAIQLFVYLSLHIAFVILTVRAMRGAPAR